MPSHRYRRIRRAKERLIGTDRSLSAIALELGFVRNVIMLDGGLGNVRPTRGPCMKQQEALELMGCNMLQDYVLSPTPPKDGLRKLATAFR